MRPSRSTMPSPRSRLALRDRVGPASAARNRAHCSRVIQTTARAAAPSVAHQRVGVGHPEQPATASCSCSGSRSERPPVIRWSATRASSSSARARAVDRDRPPGGTRARRGWRYRGPTPDRRAAPRSRPRSAGSSPPTPGSARRAGPRHRTSGRARASRRSGPGAEGVPPPRRPARRRDGRAAAARAAVPAARARRPTPSSPATSRTSSSAVSASRSSSASANASLTVRTDCPRTNPASQSGYQSPPAASASGALRRPPRCRSITSMSDPGHSSRRAYEPSATTRPRRGAVDPARRRRAGCRRRRRRGRARTPRPGGRGRRSSRSRARAQRARRSSRALQRVRARLSGADPPHVLDRHHPHLAVTDLAGVRGA